MPFLDAARDPPLQIHDTASWTFTVNFILTYQHSHSTSRTYSETVLNCRSLDL